MIVLLLSSCVTNEEIATEYISTATGLTGLEAAEVYAEGIERTDSFQLYYNLAYSYLESRDYDKAIECARTIFTDLDPLQSQSVHCIHKTLSQRYLSVKAALRIATRETEQNR